MRHTPFYVLLDCKDGRPYTLEESCLHAVLVWDTEVEAREFLRKTGLSGFVPARPDPAALDRYMADHLIKGFLWLHERHYHQLYRQPGLAYCLLDCEDEDDTDFCGPGLFTPVGAAPVPDGLRAELERVMWGGDR